MEIRVHHILDDLTVAQVGLHLVGHDRRREDEDIRIRLHQARYLTVASFECRVMQKYDVKSNH